MFCSAFSSVPNLYRSTKCVLWQLVIWYVKSEFSIVLVMMTNFLIQLKMNLLNCDFYSFLVLNVWQQCLSFHHMNNVLLILFVFAQIMEGKSVLYFMHSQVMKKPFSCWHPSEFTLCWEIHLTITTQSDSYDFDHSKEHLFWSWWRVHVWNKQVIKRLFFGPYQRMKLLIDSFTIQHIH